MKKEEIQANLYCDNINAYERRTTVTVKIGNVPMGGTNPIRVQSMTTVDTMDTEGSIEEVIRMVDSGCEYVRITAPSIKEAENLQNIKDGLLARGYNVPLVADIHFTPNAAEVAARIVEKVRINPGNYADKKKFDFIEYDDATYQEELERIRERFIPLVEICKEHGTAMRIGTNHGSLSDRILSRYGDTPLGMVESALEFLRICNDLDYHEIVLSMKASNTQVMVQAYRLLVQKMNEEGLKPYPLHLGVTEAGDGEDGRVKSAVGIGTLLEDGLGDTVRVSLTEAPEAEAPVAESLINRYDHRADNSSPIVTNISVSPKNPFKYERRKTKEVENFGDHNVPRVIADFSKVNTIEMSDLKNIGHHYLPATDKWGMSDHGADYIYTGAETLPFMAPNGLKNIIDATVWNDQSAAVPLFEVDAFFNANEVHPTINFVRGTFNAFTPVVLSELAAYNNVVLILHTNNEHAMPELRASLFKFYTENLQLPVVIEREYNKVDADQLQLYSSTDIGGLLIDGLGDGALLKPLASSDRNDLLENIKVSNRLAFGILQAARTRMTKTEYISCPSCGRTLFDLQETTAMIRKRTDHLKGVKIGIMGCIVNGPGEMADADYGYVGSGKGKITLYRGQEVVKRSVPEANAVDELINLIDEDGNWFAPSDDLLN
ncbi:(E)-4-hydroxy-3-methylbut-2-enyl-diphosphate synthase [Flammeovirga kamogawensis]|uniref:4-hydroxy-3-methylbut-2-en-1-yl diphosphate synthase (flavodoxin) n=1 Tax=Flammeovirga kamogawensis TaxID=373891 RepID=A0ABX8GX81_9BACT|nr:(E)-4-hydroxy-3-methylbut-2-enyl-diphosphate synthase [Flammeovirga kamogawensis]MBB6460842.1 (E)-4-hydroxy-3-methylbut-2-enyl-diphosphate synthase [Flammeovirga kamogawensis]QWG08191.1 (E)-4-hydroxy-3-methylbut-2-enyl-diphosphate synthase [Flammeovirga kamogawensis]TRX69994.1 (E)-4-hydroxy-3-methylbut-2-enyl-diphosphate synthase [Flammeovirga kamogawensis]